MILVELVIKIFAWVFYVKKMHEEHLVRLVIIKKSSFPIDIYQKIFVTRIFKKKEEEK